MLGLGAHKVSQAYLGVIDSPHVMVSNSRSRCHLRAQIHAEMKAFMLAKLYDNSSSSTQKGNLKA